MSPSNAAESHSAECSNLKAEVLKNSFKSNSTAEIKKILDIFLVLRLIRH